MSDVINIAVNFTFPAVDHLPSYTDTLFIPLEEYQAMNPGDLDALKQARYDNWYAAVTNPPVETPPEVNAMDEAERALSAARDAVATAQTVLDEARAAAAPTQAG